MQANKFTDLNTVTFRRPVACASCAAANLLAEEIINRPAGRSLADALASLGLEVENKRRQLDELRRESFVGLKETQIGRPSCPVAVCNFGCSSDRARD